MVNPILIAKMGSEWKRCYLLSSPFLTFWKAKDFSQNSMDHLSLPISFDIHLRIWTGRYHSLHPQSSDLNLFSKSITTWFSTRWFCLLSCISLLTRLKAHSSISSFLPSLDIAICISSYLVSFMCLIPSIRSSSMMVWLHRTIGLQLRVEMRT